ncbi:nuclear factor 1 C-type-like isoform X3 [Oryctolagus cuniculus]|uniref:nuclear factor 1 C-type-like isoform X3 n=1 Tax=Oryctolagus cuniculus TaxID=9986 RepID=UPI00387A4AA5
MDKSPFNSPSPQDSPRLSSFTQHHRPVIVVHSGPGWKHARAPAPPPALTAQVQRFLPLEVPCLGEGVHAWAHKAACLL